MLNLEQIKRELKKYNFAYERMYCRYMQTDIIFYMVFMRRG